MSTSDSETPAIDDRDLLVEVDRLITRLEAHPDPDVRSDVATLLRGIDAVHRAGLSHLVGAIRSLAGDAFINRLIAHPAIRLLLMSYDLIAVDRRLQAEEALDPVRGHLHRHGVDVEITSVTGGVVSVTLHGVDSARHDLGAVRHDLEEALAASLPGFQELVLGDARPGRADGGFVPLSGLRRARRPVRRRVCSIDDLGTEDLKPLEIDGIPILIVRVRNEVYAIRNRCGASPLPLEFGALDGAELRCSWHGCRYDVRTGHRVDGETDRLQVFPIRIEEGTIYIVIDSSAGDEGP